MTNTQVNDTWFYYYSELNNWKAEDHNVIVEINDLCKASPAIVIIIAVSIFAILVLGAVGFYFLLRRVNASKAKGRLYEAITVIIPPKTIIWDRQTCSFLQNKI